MATISRSSQRTAKPRRAAASVTVYLIPVADAVETKTYDSESDALDFEHEFNQRQKKRHDGKFIAFADVEHVIRPRRNSSVKTNGAAWRRA